MSKEFTEAAASYFGIDPARLADSTLTSNAEGLTLHLKIRLTDDDMIGIGKRMEERRKPVDEKGEWWPTPTEAAQLMAKRQKQADAMNVASHMHYKDDTGTWHAGQSPLAAHYHGPDTRMYRNDGTAIPPAPTKGHP